MNIHIISIHQYCYKNDEFTFLCWSKANNCSQCLNVCRTSIKIVFVSFYNFSDVVVRFIFGAVQTTYRLNDCYFVYIDVLLRSLVACLHLKASFFMSYQRWVYCHPEVTKIECIEHINKYIDIHLNGNVFINSVHFCSS